MSSSHNLSYSNNSNNLNESDELNESNNLEIDVKDIMFLIPEEIQKLSTDEIIKELEKLISEYSNTNPNSNSNPNTSSNSSTDSNDKETLSKLTQLLTQMKAIKNKKEKLLKIENSLLNLKSSVDDIKNFSDEIYTYANNIDVLVYWFKMTLNERWNQEMMKLPEQVYITNEDSNKMIQKHNEIVESLYEEIQNKVDEFIAKFDKISIDININLKQCDASELNSLSNSSNTDSKNNIKENLVKHFESAKENMNNMILNFLPTFKSFVQPLITQRESKIALLIASLLSQVRN